MNLRHKGIIITIMKLKLTLINEQINRQKTTSAKIALVIFTQTIFITGLFVTNTTLADNIKQSAISGKPYEDGGLNTNIPSRDLDTNLPDLGDIAQTVLTPQDEQRIAEQILRQVAVSDDVLEDAEVTDYLQAVGQRLAASGPDKRQTFNFFVVRDNSINAFAMPGGIIGVHTGLILASNSESEMAGVLGHEIGHVTQRHLARMLASQKYDTFKNIAGIALALLVARANPELASGALTASTAAGVQRQLDYTREHEREADRVGLTILDAAGYDVRAMPAFFTTLQRGTRFVEGTAPSFLRSHPLTAERIADVSNRVETMPYRQVPDSLDFQLVKAKLRAGNGMAQSAIDQFQDNLKERRFANETAENYGLAVAMLRKNDLAGASKQMQWLKTNAAKHPFIENLAARIEVARNNPQAAAIQYAKALTLFPNHRALIYGYAEHYLATNQPDKALQLIAEKQPLFPTDAYFYDMMAKAYAAKGKDLLRFQAQGEAYYRKYNLSRAVEQFDFAVKAKDGNFYEHSIVDARLKELRRLQANEKTALERMG
ncbi:MULTISPECIES: beta-barrel assembly-enhancing protease [Methylotenera]|uniref:beta-barrel assembly-enhancing protease n=1 Tax=Methylotenera TaxID=359407 RepID=UPI0003617441|nr:MULTISPECIES: M48 family metalloprotease [Methylotenera]